jgi:UDPglucose--hexose-1-phosphate uridylyltransferase
MENMELYISQLIEYAVQKDWIGEADRIWAANRILETLHMDGFEGLVPLDGKDGLPPIQEILDHLCDYAF